MFPHTRSSALEAYRQGDPLPLQSLCELLRASGQPEDEFPFLHLAAIHSAQGRTEEAIRLLQDGLTLFPSCEELHVALAGLLFISGHYEKSLEHCARVTDNGPQGVKSLLLGAECLSRLGQGAESESKVKRAMALGDDSLAAWQLLVKGLFLQGRVPAAIEICRDAQRRYPDDLSCLIGMIFAMLYDEHSSMEEFLIASKELAARMEHGITRRTHRNSPLPHRRLRIGFLSPDLRNHSVMYFAEPLIAGLPRDHFEIFCYFTYPREDSITHRVRQLTDKFRPISLKNPIHAAATIRQDEVDILVDCAGHTGYGGLPVMAHRPAPVQVSWLGYPATTGLSSIDWRITDHFADPIGTDIYYTEKLVRMPGCFAVYRPHIRNPFHRFDQAYAVAPCPVDRNGWITFGSCNNLAKVSDRCISAWCQVLQRLPESRMLIEGKGLDNEASKRRLRDQFAKHGICDGRIIYVARNTKRQYLTYHDIDIALDTFPLTGGTTTFDALYMGVPVVSLVGHALRERLSGTVLSAGSFVDDICRSEKEYVDRAVLLAQDIPALRTRRAMQREKMQASTLMNESDFCSKFGQALRMIWLDWCRQQAFEDDRSSAGGNSNVHRVEINEDVLLVPVNETRVTLRVAREWLKRLMQRLRGDKVLADIESARALALAILWVWPNDPLAAEAIQATVEWDSSVEEPNWSDDPDFETNGLLSGMQQP